MTTIRQPSFSVCIPNFNYAHYLPITIDSVLAQTYPHVEIVVVDNASTDDSVAVVESYGSERVRLARNPYNVGFAPNLDRAAASARNDFILVLSADDVMRPDALEAYARVIAKLGSRAAEALFVSGIDVIDEHGAVKRSAGRLDHFRSEPDPVLTDLIDEPGVQAFDGAEVFREVFPRMGVPGSFCTTVYSKRLYESVGGYSSVNLIGPDAHFSYKVMLRGAPVVFIDRPLFGYRIHQSNQLSQLRSTKILKVPVDRYLFTFLYDDQSLSRVGVGRNEVIEAMIDRDCLRAGLGAMSEGARLEAMRLLAFGLSVYPYATVRNLKSYLLGALLLLGPIGTALARWGLGWRRSRRKQ